MKKLISLFMFLTLATLSLSEVNLYGPGGPHTALIEISKLYKEKTGKDVKINFGPQGTWNDKVPLNGDILFGASEQSATAIAEGHSTLFDIKNIESLYLRRAIILVKKGNPKKISGLKDLTNKEIGIVVNDGKGKSNTSGTGVWEDMMGRTKNIELFQKFKNNIKEYALNSGGARNKFLEDSSIDAWVTWIDWAKSNPQYGDVVEIEPELVIYRTFNVVPRKEASKEALEFIEFLKKDESKAIFEKFGWTK